MACEKLIRLLMNVVGRIIENVYLFFFFWIEKKIIGVGSVIHKSSLFFHLAVSAEPILRQTTRLFYSIQRTRDLRFPTKYSQGRYYYKCHTQREGEGGGGG